MSRPGSPATARWLLAATAVVLALVGGGAVVAGVAGEPPVVTRVAGTGSPAPPPADPVRRSPPVALDIPAIKVHSTLLTLGLNPDGTVEVPPVDSPQAGWYKDSPTPGELGPAVILGHVDSAKAGPGVFYELRALRPGDDISVTRADGSVVAFRVDRVAEYPKQAFPTDAVYGDIDHAGLRLVTCGGTFDAATRSYVDNIVVYASSVSPGKVQ